MRWLGEADIFFYVFSLYYRLCPWILKSVCSFFVAVVFVVLLFNTFSMEYYRTMHSKRTHQKSYSQNITKVCEGQRQREKKDIVQYRNTSGNIRLGENFKFLTTYNIDSAPTLVSTSFLFFFHFTAHLNHTHALPISDSYQADTHQLRSQKFIYLHRFRWFGVS